MVVREIAKAFAHWELDVDGLDVEMLPAVSSISHNHAQSCELTGQRY